MTLMTQKGRCVVKAQLIIIIIGLYFIIFYCSAGLCSLPAQVCVCISSLALFIRDTRNSEDPDKFHYTTILEILRRLYIDTSVISISCHIIIKKCLPVAS